MTPKQRAKELIDYFKEIEVTVLGCGTTNPCIVSGNMLENKAKQCALKVAKSEWDVLEKARVFEQHDYYLELFKEIENY